MNNQPENVKTTVSIPPKSDDLFRKQAFKDRITMSELFIEYQKAYLKELEREKDNKRLIKELKEKDLVRITVAISTKAGEKLKLQTEQWKITPGELLEKYQKQYSQFLADEERDKKLEKQWKEKGIIDCPYCKQIVRRQ